MSIFSNVAGRKTRRTKFNLSAERKLSFNMGELIPIMNEEVVPGDSFKVNSELLIRMAPMIAPMMHRVNVYTHYFFVPNRIIWEEWEDFITGGRQGDKLPQHPTVGMNDPLKVYFKKGSLADYFGLPIIDQAQTVVNPVNVSALPFRAYQTIYNEYYQDQNLSEPIDINLGSGPISGNQPGTHCTLRKRAWEKDYFTSGLPWSQRGPEATLPADVNYKYPAQYQDGSGTPAPDLAASFTGGGKLNAGGSFPTTVDNIDNLGITINNLRKSVRLQEWLERTARGGSRYIEQIMSHFGVRSSDARLQRPEFLGGGKNPVVISEVLNTAGPTGATTPLPQGNMSGHGISVGRTNGFKRRFEEHGYVIGIMSVLPKTAYQQGIERQWTRTDKFDYYWPEFAQLGEQEIKTKELFADFYGGTNTLENTWAYQSRYAEYKYKCSSVHGDYRDTLNFWHMGRIFDEVPSLNQDFVTSDPTSRIFAVTSPDEDKLYCQVYNSVSAIRPMPYFNNPSL